MATQDSENLRELLERFLAPEQVERAVEDIRRGEQILRDNPAPKPDANLITNTEVEIARVLQTRKKASAFAQIARRMIAAAAVVMVAAAIGLMFLGPDDHGRGKVATASMMPRAIWESEDIVADDADLAVLTAEIEQLEDEALSLELGENDGIGEKSVVELEIELIAIETDFWKG
jgi:hypothetical protein